MLNYLRFIFFISIVLLIISCDQDNPTKPKDFAPVLSDLAVPDTILTGIDQSFIFTVNCKDENGLDDIDSVAFKILSNTGQIIVSGIMFDDGNYETHGDNVPNNGKHSVRLKFDVNQGEYRFTVQAVDQTKLRSNELSDTFYAIPGIKNLAPVITKHHIPDTVFVDEIISFYLSVYASDPDSGDFVSKVTYQILAPSLTGIVEQGDLNDQGIKGDSLAGDGIYSIETTTAFANWKFGNYPLIIQAFDSRNKASEQIYVILPWAKLKIGVAPQIDDIGAPEIIQLPSSDAKSYLLTASVIDADDNRDVKEVVFDTFKPDGSPAAGNSFKMYDDGTSGDARAGDFIFSLTIFITPQNLTGDYRFEFQAKDYSDLSSNKVVHTIRVIN